jgi:metallo-beta-lactamase family protein
LRIEFLGAARTVTGSKTLLEVGSQKILIDCGLYQGIKELRLRNRDPLSIPADSIQKVLLTHAHLDHSGYLPILVKNGFRGKILCTKPTQELLRILLLDMAHLEAEEAKLQNRLKISKHQPALPLFTQADVTAALRKVEPLSEGDWHQLGDGLKVKLRENGHILGSVSAFFSYRGRTLLFSGDLGRKRPLTLRSPKPPVAADVMVLESTYGDRFHETEPPEEELGNIIRKTAKRGGTIYLPSFAVGRSQDLLYLLSRLRKSENWPNLPVYLDSPMAIEVSQVLLRNLDWQKLSRAEIRAMFLGVKPVKTGRESEALRLKGKPAIILAGSGMITGGRILGHLEEGVGNPLNTLVLTGFQAPGTRGALLAAGSPEIKVRGLFLPVRAEVVQINSLSAHADRGELLEWVAKAKPKSIYLNHGEPQATDALRVLLEDRLGIPVFIPKFQEIVDIPS